MILTESESEYSDHDEEMEEEDEEPPSEPLKPANRFAYSESENR